MKYLTLFLIHYSLFTIHHSAAAPADEQRVTKGNASAPEQGDRRGASEACGEGRRFLHSSEFHHHLHR